MNGEATKDRLLKLPRRFFDDHVERELPAPTVVRQTQRHVWIRQDDPNLPELVNDADFHADGLAPDCLWISLAARALLRALERQGVDWRRWAVPNPPSDCY